MEYNFNPQEIREIESIVREYNQDLNVYDVLEKLNSIKPFEAQGNIFEDSDGIDSLTFVVMRKVAEIQLREVFKTLKFDLNDPNLSNKESIGTPARIIKTITGKEISDDSEMMCGRYSKPPKLATFPNDSKTNIPVVKRVDISSVCSHHFLPYGTFFSQDSYAIVAYIPKDKVLGISKLQRYVNYYAKRPTIQEGLVKNIFEGIKKIAETEDVYVGIFNAVHTCEKLRGARSQDGSFTTEIYGGQFEKDPELVKNVKRG